LIDFLIIYAADALFRRRYYAPDDAAAMPAIVESADDAITPRRLPLLDVICRCCCRRSL